MTNLTDLGFCLDEQKLVIPGLTKTYTIVQVTDAHLCPDSELDTEAQREKCSKNRIRWATPTGASQEEMLIAARDYAKEIGADLFCCTGDMVNSCFKGSFASLRGILAGQDKLLYAPGNHEKVDEFRDELASIYPHDYGFRACDLGEIVVAAVDNRQHSIADEDFEKLKALLDGDKPVILTQHIPLAQDRLCEAAIEKWTGIDYFIFGRKGDWARKDEYYDLLTQKQTALRAVLCGHLHLTNDETFDNGVIQCVSAPCFEGYMRVLTICG